MSATPMPKLTPAERRVLHGLGFVATCRINDDRLELVIAAMRRDIETLSEQPATRDLIAAGQAVCGAFSRRARSGGGLAWCEANIDASRVSQSYHWAAFCALDGI